MALSGDDRFGLAVSGGPDSLGLLLLAHGALPGRIEAASVDHGLRPGSAEEAASVARICETLDIPHRTLTVAVAGGNVQSGARAARYRALSQWAGAAGLDAVMTAHHADDQAETLLMRMNRGSGLAGLASIRASAPIPHAPPGYEGMVLRPLLRWRKAELAECVRAAGLDPIDDPSNADPRFDRARVRTALRETDWLDAAGLARSAGLLAQAHDLVESMVEEKFAACAFPEGAGYRLEPCGPAMLRVELAARVLEAMDAPASRTMIAAAIERLEKGENASLSGVLITPAGARAGGWRFRPEPPRGPR